MARRGVKRSAWFGDERPKLPLDTIDHIVWRRRARGDAHRTCTHDPFRSNVRLRLDVVHVRTMLAARVHKLTGVVAVLSAHDDDDVALTCQVDGCALALLRWVTHGIDEANVRLRESLSHQRDQVTHPLDRLCGLGTNAKTLTIDPVLTYSSVFGGSGESNLPDFSFDAGSSIAVDSQGNAYIAGTAYSQDFQPAGLRQRLNLNASRASGGAHRVIGVVQDVEEDLLKLVRIWATSLSICERMVSSSFFNVSRA